MVTDCGSELTAVYGFANALRFDFTCTAILLHLSYVFLQRGLFTGSVSNGAPCSSVC
jgi:hypothetical protein